MEAGPPAHGTGARRSALGRRLTTETKQAFKTTEFWIYVVILIALLIAGAVADGGDSTVAEAEGGDGGFGAEKVWLYAVILSVGYMISRGLAKAGAHDPYSEGSSAGDEGGLGDRLKAAAQVLKEGEGGATSSTAPTQQHRASQEY